MSSRPNDEEHDPATSDEPDASLEDELAAVRSLEDARRQRLASRQDDVSRDTSPCLIIPGAAMECPAEPPPRVQEPPSDVELSTEEVEAPSRSPANDQWSASFRPTYLDEPASPGDRLVNWYFRLVHPIVHPLLWLMVFLLMCASLAYVAEVKPRLARLRAFEDAQAIATEEARTAPKIIDLATATHLLQSGASFVSLPLASDAASADRDLVVGFVAPSDRGGETLLYVLEHRFRSVGVLPGFYDSSARALERRQAELLGILTPHLPPLSLAPQLQPKLDSPSTTPSSPSGVAP